MPRNLSACLGLLPLLVLGACDDDTNTPLTPDLAAADAQTAASDLSEAADASLPDLAAEDLSMPDLAPAMDLAMPDLKSCAASAFLACAGNSAIYCNSTGNSTMAVDCGSACTGATGCGQCTASTVACSGNTLVSCDAFGRKTETACGVGCADAITDADLGVSAAHCKNLTPSNGITASCSAAPTGADLVISSDTIVDPDNGTLGGVLPTGVTFVVVAQPVTDTLPAGPDIGVFHVKSLTINSGVALRAKTGAANALAVVADTTIVINGTIDVAAHLDGAKSVAIAGPGHSPTGHGDGSPAGTVSSPSIFRGSGGGGAGHATAGGNGGKSSAFAGFAGAQYPPAGDPFEMILVPLEGGSQGGGVSGSEVGRGGGAVQLVACSAITVGAGGVINASGSGAPKSALATATGGAGGGSGGGILLEAPMVTVTAGATAGVLAATGGGGAGGGVGSTTARVQGEAGSDGSLDPTCTGVTGGAGAMQGASTGGAGGVGACGLSSATDGNAATTTAPDTAAYGGGGAAGGRIRVNGTSITIDATQSVTPRSGANYTTGAITVR